TISGVVGTDTLTLQAGPPDFQTGEAVAYTAGEVDPGNGKFEKRPIGKLVDGWTYFVIRVDATTVKLALSREQALAANPIPLGPFTAPTAGHENTLTRATALVNVQSLLGG